jgi:hypothetical protein
MLDQSYRHGTFTLEAFDCAAGDTVLTVVTNDHDGAIDGDGGGCGDGSGV